MEISHCHCYSGGGEKCQPISKNGKFLQQVCSCSGGEEKERDEREKLHGGAWCKIQQEGKGKGRHHVQLQIEIDATTVTTECGKKAKHKNKMPSPPKLRRCKAKCGGVWGKGRGKGLLF